MASVSVLLKQPWPTALGLRRPQEGPIMVSQADADAILEAEAGEIIPDTASDDPAPAKRPVRKAKPADTTTAETPDETSAD